MTDGSEREKTPVAPDAGEGPLVTVVIPTRDRGSQAVAPVMRLLAGDFRRFVLHVVDQSAGEETGEALAEFAAEPRIHYQRSSTKGISAALNRGIEQAETEFIAITGDDCEPVDAWLTTLLEPFGLDPRIGVVFGSVVAGDHDEAHGFVPASERTRNARARGIHEQHRIGGTSACMALRKSLWDELGGFDEMLGVGAPLQAGEDLDFTIRSLLAGHHVYEVAAAEVVHRGFFAWSEQSTVIRRNWFGTGAAFAKCVRRGHPGVLLNLARLVWRWGTAGPTPVAASLANRPLPRRTIVGALARGFVRGIMLPVASGAGHFQRRAG